MQKWVRRGLVLSVLVLLLAGGWTAWRLWLAPRPLPEGLVQANGRIEGDELLVAAEFGGRIHKLFAKEGDAVDKGDVLARLEDEQTRQRVLEAEQRLQQARSKTAALQKELEILKKEVPLQIKSAKKALDAAQADMQRADAARDQARREAERFAELLRRDTVARQAAERYATELKTANRRVQATAAEVARREKALQQARLGKERVQARQRQVDAAKAAEAKSKAALHRAEATLEDMAVRAPASGKVLERVAELGEVVPAGAVLYKLVNLDALYLKAYVPEKQAVLLAPGQPARIHPDAYPGKYAPASLRYIASQAEFTPKEVQTPEQRSDLVYAVKLYLRENPQQRLTPGLPADAVIKVDESASWAPPRR